MAAQRPRRQAATRRNDASHLKRRITRLEAALKKLNRTWVAVRSDDRKEVLAALRVVEKNSHDLEVQFRRIAQMQSDLDDVRRAWERQKPTPSRTDA